MEAQHRRIALLEAQVEEQTKLMRHLEESVSSSNSDAKATRERAQRYKTQLERARLESRVATDSLRAEREARLALNTKVRRHSVRAQFK